MAENDAFRVVDLGKDSVDDILPTGDRFIVWDRDLKGFGLRVEPSGAKTFIIRYRVGGGRRGTRRQTVIGRLGKITPAQARKKATVQLATITLGQDPQGAIEARRAELTMTELCDTYLAEGVGTKKASTLKLDGIRIERHIKPRLGGKKVSDVGRGDIERLMMEIADGRIRAGATPHTRGGKTAATRTVGLLMGIFNFAVARKMRIDNPAKGLKRFKDKSRERFLSPAEMGRLGDVLKAMADQDMNIHHLAIFRLLALTGARKSEIACLKWTEVDFNHSCLRLGDSKSGQKVIALGPPAIEVLGGVGSDRSGYVFPDPRDAGLPIRNLDWAWVKVRNAAGLQDVRPHDLRHSFASAGVLGGASLLLISKLLGHSDVRTTQRYAHLGDEPVRAAVDGVSAAVAGALAKTVPADPDPAIWQPANDR